MKMAATGRRTWQADHECKSRFNYSGPEKPSRGQYSEILYNIGKTKSTHTSLVAQLTNVAQPLTTSMSKIQCRRTIQVMLLQHDGDTYLSESRLASSKNKKVAL